MPQHTLPTTHDLEHPLPRPLTKLVDVDTRLRRSLPSLVPLHRPTESPKDLPRAPHINDIDNGVLYLGPGSLDTGRGPPGSVTLLDSPHKVARAQSRLEARVVPGASRAPSRRSPSPDGGNVNARAVASMRARDPLRSLTRTASMLGLRRKRVRLARKEARTLSRAARRAARGSEDDGGSCSSLEGLSTDDDESDSDDGRGSSGGSSSGGGGGRRRRSDVDAADAASAGLGIPPNRVVNVLAQLSEEQLASVQRAFAAAPDQEMSRLEFVATLELALNLSSESGVNTADSESAHEAVVADLCEIFNRADIAGRGVVTATQFLDYVLHAGESRQEIDSLGITAYGAGPQVLDMEHDEQITFVAGFAEIPHLVTCHKNGLVSVWNPSNAVLVKRLRGHRASSLCAEIIPASAEVQIHRLATSSVDRTIILWDTSSYTKLAQWRTDTPQVALAWAAPLRRLFSGGTDGLVKSFDPKTAEDEMLVYPKGHSDWITSLTYIPAIASLVSASLDSNIVVWDTERARKRVTLTGHLKAVHSVAYSDKAKVIVSGGVDRDLLVWNPFVDSVLQRMTGHEKPILAVMAVPRSHEIISADMAGKIKVWDIRRFQCLQTLGGRGSPHFRRPFETVAYSPRTSAIVTVSRQWLVYTPLGETMVDSAAKLPPSVIIYNTAFDNILVLAGLEVTIWDVATAKAISTYSHFSTAEILELVLSRNQRQIVTANAMGIVSVFNYSTGAPMLSFLALGVETLYGTMWFGATRPLESKFDAITFPADMPDTAVTSTAFAIDNVCGLYHVADDAILVTTMQGFILVYDTSNPGSERVIYTLHAPQESKQFDVTASAFCPVSRMFAAGGSGGVFQIWKLDTYSSFHTHRVDQDITAAVFASNMEAFVTADTAGTITVYSLGSFSVLAQLDMGPSVSLMQLHYSPAAKVLVSDHRVSIDGPIHATAWSMVAVARDFWADVEANEDARARGTETVDPHDGSIPLVLSQSEAYLHSIDQEVALVTGASASSARLDPTSSHMSDRAAADAERVRRAAAERMRRVVQGRGRMQASETASSLRSRGSTDEMSQSVTSVSGSQRRRRRLRETDAVPLHVLAGRETPGDYEVLVQERATRRRATHIKFPRHLSGDRRVVHTDLNAFCMHAWDGGSSNVVCLAVSHPVPALLMGTQAGQVLAFSPYGVPYGELLLKAEVPKWSFPLEKAELLPKMADEALEAVLVEKVTELTSPQRWQQRSASVPLQTRPSGILAGLRLDFGSGDSSSGSDDDQLDAEDAAMLRMLGHSPSLNASLDASHSGSPLRGNTDSDQAHAIVTALKRPANRGPRKLEYVKEKERYMGALSPFYNELKRSSYQPQVVRPFFLPKSTANVRQDAMLRGREEVSSSNFWKMRREAEAKQHVIEANPMWKEYVMAKKRRASSRQQQYVPTFEGRAKRLDMPGSEKPWQMKPGQSDESTLTQEKRAELRKKAAAERAKAQAEAKADMEAEASAARKAAARERLRAARDSRRAATSLGLASPLDTQHRAQLTRQNTMKQLQSTLGVTRSTLDLREKPAGSSRRLRGSPAPKPQTRDARATSRRASVVRSLRRRP